MKRTLFYFTYILFIFLIDPVIACDVCGCKLGGYYFGILPQYQSHFIGIRYSSASFDAYIDNRYAQDEFSHDTFTQMELMGRYNISQNFQAGLTLPYVSNSMSGNFQNVKSGGLGDPMILLNYMPFTSSENTESQWMQSLMLGVGIKLPIGEYRKVDNTELLNRNFQIGTGSLDYLFNLNYVIRRNQIGLNIEGSYKVNGKNPDQYQFGNQWNASANLFYWINVGTSGILPLSGIHWEKANPHFENQLKVDNSGGGALLMNFGVQTFIRNFTFSFTYQQPMLQDYYTDDISTITSNGRFMAGIMINFRRKMIFDLEIMSGENQD